MPEPVILNQRYQLQDQLATGGMAVVYRAYDLSLERFVAVKVLHKDLSDEPELRDQFRQEAKAVANLSHPNIVTVHDFGLDADRLFIVMEYVPGTDLKTILRQRRSLAVDEGLALFIQACAGIGYAHRAGVIHCDVKPQNMLVTPDQIVKVVDFGIARVFAGAAPLEQAEEVWGSPQYISPEQADGSPPLPSSDVYSLGIVLYEMLAGQLPFAGDTAEELLRQHREDDPTPPRRLNPQITPELERVILKILSKEPSARYRTADQLRHVLLNLSAPAATQIQGYSPAALAGTGMLPPQSLPAVAPSAAAQTPQAPGAAARRTAVPPPAAARPVRRRSIDWLTWLLVIAAILAVGGLIPFWLWVYSNIQKYF